MAENLLEREQFLSALDGLLHQATEGHGRLALVSGEAGIGKTALVEAFLAHEQPTPRTLWGTCEALFTPRPLGPLYDIAQQTTVTLRDVLVTDTNRATLFATVLDELTHAAAPTVMVIEDIHWADEATLDLIKYLARRIHRTPALLILTYRDDEIDKDHPLRLVLGDLPTGVSSRLRLPLLSEAAVAALAEQAHRPTQDLYAVTGGNPFFLAEVLVSDPGGIPSSVSDAVLARVARRSPEAQRLLEVVAVSPGRIERWVVAALDAGEERTLEECLAAGILRLDGHAFAFRHELARQAVENALSPARRQTLNAQVLHALLESEIEPASLARLAHHAAQAEDSALVLRFASEAGRQASAQGAHREAAAHYQSALQYANGLNPEKRADLLEDLADELYLTGRHRDAMQPFEEALAIRRALGHTERIGYNLRRLSRLNWFLDDVPRAEQCGLAAVDALETLPPYHELAMAYANMAHIRMLECDVTDTRVWSGRAIELAERINDAEALSYALNSLGAVELDVNDERGRAPLERSLEIALEHGLEYDVARAYANLSVNKIGRRDYEQAEDFIQKGMAYCAEHDLGTWEHTLRSHRSLLRLAQGDWVRAAEDAAAVLSIPWGASTNRIPCLLVLGQIRARRGDPGADEALDEARDLAVAAMVLRAGVLDNFVAIAAVRAEARWLRGDRERCIVEARAGVQEALKHPYPWYIGEVAILLWRCGELHEAPVHTFGPYAQQMAGNWQAAANSWEQLGCPYEHAHALMDGDEAAQRDALDIFERLGATPAAEIVRRQLRNAGIRGLPRGPRSTTKANPQGLTNRQLEILLLMAEGIRNPEIADRLSTTLKTVEHHVSAVLAKLGVRSRAEAVHAAYELGSFRARPRHVPLPLDLQLATPLTRKMGV